MGRTAEWGTARWPVEALRHAWAREALEVLGSRFLKSKTT